MLEEKLEELESSHNLTTTFMEIGRYIGNELNFPDISIEDRIRDMADELFSFYFRNEDRFKTILKQSDNLEEHFTEAFTALFASIDREEMMQPLVVNIIVSINMELNEAIVEDKELLVQFAQILCNASPMHTQLSIRDYIIEGYRKLRDEFGIPDFDVCQLLIDYFSNLK